MNGLFFSIILSLGVSQLQKPLEMDADKAWGENTYSHGQKYRHPW